MGNEGQTEDAPWAPAPPERYCYGDMVQVSTRGLASADRILIARSQRVVRIQELFCSEAALACLAIGIVLLLKLDLRRNSTWTGGNGLLLIIPLVGVPTAWLGRWHARKRQRELGCDAVDNIVCRFSGTFPTSGYLPPEARAIARRGSEQQLDALPNSGIVISLDGRPSNARVRITAVASRPTSSAAARAWAKTIIREKHIHEAASHRTLDEAERAELRRHVVDPLAVVVLLFLMSGMAGALGYAVLRGGGGWLTWLLGGIPSVFAISSWWVISHHVLLAVRLRADAVNGIVVCYWRTEGDSEQTVELLPSSSLAWTLNGQAADWRLQSHRLD